MPANHINKALEKLIVTLPLHLLERLGLALSGIEDAPLKAVGLMVMHEQRKRKLKKDLFFPYIGLFQQNNKDFSFPAQWLEIIWKRLLDEEKEHIDMALRSLAELKDGQVFLPIYHSLIKTCASYCRLRPDDFDSSSQEDLLERLEDLAVCFDIYRMAKEVSSVFADYLAAPSDAKATNLKHLFRDASDIAPKGGVILLEITNSTLNDHTDIFKLIGILSDHANDRFLCGTELGNIAERTIKEIETTLNEACKNIRGQTPAPGHFEDNFSMIIICLKQMQTVQNAIQLTREGPWGKRFSMMQTKAVEQIEGLIRSCIGLIDEVLPLKSQKHGLAIAKIDRTPKAEKQLALRTLMAYFDELLIIARTCGFSSLLSETKTHITHHIDSYFDSLLVIAKSEEEFDYNQLMLAFDTTEEMMALEGGLEKAHIARRRIACLPIISQRNDLVS